MAIEKIVIVGGGTAGWMAAAALSRLKTGRELGRHAGRIRSNRHGGRRRGNHSALRRTSTSCSEMDEREMLAEVAGTFKLGIQFENWGADRRKLHPPLRRLWLHNRRRSSFHHVWHRMASAGRQAPDPGLQCWKRWPPTSASSRAREDHAARRLAADQLRLSSRCRTLCRISCANMPKGAVWCARKAGSPMSRWMPKPAISSPP